METLYDSNQPYPSSTATTSDVVYQMFQVSVASMTTSAMAAADRVFTGADPSYATVRNDTVFAPAFLPSPSYNLPSRVPYHSNGSQVYPNVDLSPGSGNATDTPTKNIKDFTLYWIGLYINRYYLWVVFAFGFPGNIVSFITILHMKPFTSPTIYVAALALVDNLCLLAKIIFFLLTKFDAPLGDSGCGTLIFLGSFTAHLANWLLVAMTLERCLAICLPLRVGTICTRKVHIAGLTATCLVLAGLNVQALVTSDMVQRSSGDILCSQDQGYANFHQIWNWVDAFVYSILPAMLLIVMNTLIIMGIRRSAQIQRELTSKASQAAETMKQQKQITIMLVIVCLVFVVLITPHALFFAVEQNVDIRGGNIEEIVRYKFTSQIIFVLSDSTHAVNFYLYFFSTKRFRKRCLETILYCCYCCSWGRAGQRGGGSRRRNRKHYGGSSTCGMSKSYRLSMTDITSMNPNQKNGNGNGDAGNYGESCLLTSSSSSSSNGRLLVMNNGDGAKHKISRKHRDQLV